jgi:predicted amidohydrolase
VNKRKIPVAALQIAAHDRAQFDSRWPRIEALVNEAGKRGAKLIVLPEGTVPGYVLGTEAVPLQQLERASLGLAALARQYEATVIYGGAKIVDGLTFNAAIAIGPDGRELGYAAKQFLWHFDRRWFAPGRTLEPIDTPVGRLGLLVCADGRIPTIAATLAERGAELLVMPTAWVTSGRDPAALENLQADLMFNVRARENGLPCVVANKAGVELQSVAYCGKSALIDAGGAFVARAGQRDEEIVFGELTVGERGSTAAGALTAVSGPGHGVARARVAFTLAADPEAVGRFSRLAADADADLLLARGPADVARGPMGDAPRAAVLAVPPGAANVLLEQDGVRFGIVDDETMFSPRGLVRARLHGLDAFVWQIERDDAAWNVPFARTRAAELRAFVVVFDVRHERAFAVDPDGVVVAGTFDDFRVASFVYDRARTAATTVAPTTDVFAGLRTAEAIRAAGLTAPASR